MTDFELQRQLRQLAVEQRPSRDLWPAIAARMGAEVAGAPPARPRRGATLARAAGLLLALGLGVFALSTQQPTWQGSSATSGADADHGWLLLPAAVRAKARASGLDPQLAGAALVLDAAHGELEQAMTQNPDATFLTDLLHRTNAQRMRLTRRNATSG